MAAKSRKSSFIYQNHSLDHALNINFGIDSSVSTELSSKVLEMKMPFIF